eukprot:185846-Pelagomonas_calceolata.AAC.1
MDCPVQTVRLRLLKRILRQLGFTMLYCAATVLQKKRKVYAGQRPHALRKGPLTSRLEKQYYTQ